MDLIKQALSQYGVKEIPGEENNPVILEYFKEIGHSWVQEESTAWCSAYVNWCAKRTGYEYTGKLDARSWLSVGNVVTEPEVGDVVIFWRVKKDSWYGHVGFYISEDEHYIYVLGGNQSNMVNISPYPKYRLLGYRRLREGK